MEQKINDKPEKLKGELKEKSRIFLEWVLVITYLVLLIYFVFRPLVDFMAMVEYTLKLGILEYFIKWGNDRTKIIIIKHYHSLNKGEKNERHNWKKH